MADSPLRGGGYIEKHTKEKDKTKMIKITWLGTASILLEACGQKLLFDPFVELAGGSNPNTLEDFEGVRDICITHGHLDHLFFVPELVEGQDATVHCPAPAARTLEGFLEDNGNVVVASPGDHWRLGELSIWVHRGKHVAFSPSVVLGRLFSPQVLRHFRNLLFLAWAHPRFRERGETLVYEVQAEGRKILLLGSMALDDAAEYPKGADLLILPYQGKRRPEEAACEIVSRLQPKRILLDHFDNAFPPASRDEDTRPFYRLLGERFPQVQAVKPKAGKTVCF